MITSDLQIRYQQASLLAAGLSQSTADSTTRLSLDGNSKHLPVIAFHDVVGWLRYGQRD